MKVRAYLRRDGLLLLGSLLLALLVWKYVDDELTETRTVQARLELRVPRGLTLVGRRINSVEVVLRGPRGRMAALDPAEVAARYELPAESSGQVPVSLGEKNFRLPEGVQIAELPTGLTVTVERQAVKRVKVKVPRLTGEPAEGYVVVRAPRVKPAEVAVRGTKEKIESLEQLDVEEIDISGRSEGFDTMVSVQAPPDVHCSERVLVIVDIGRPPQARTVEGIKIRLLLPSGFERKVSLAQTTVSLRIQGEPRRVTGVTPRDIIAMVDVSRLAGSEAGGSYPLQVQVQLPPGVVLAPGFKLPRVDVRLEK
jgi:YbbR domain-containing protein